LNISEIVAQKHLLARLTALELAVAKLERANQVSEIISAADKYVTAFVAPEKRKPGRPRKNA
jgi:hypothetical protein